MPKFLRVTIDQFGKDIDVFINPENVLYVGSDPGHRDRAAIHLLNDQHFGIKGKPEEIAALLSY